MKQSFFERLGNNSYPGRGVFIGLTPNGRQAVLAYFIMGRSENSRNRVFVEDGDTLRIFPFDKARVRDASLILYAPVRVCGDFVIVANGDQSDTIYVALQSGRSFEDALRTRSFEPDAPNDTPRISGLLSLDGADFSYKLSILKKQEGKGKKTQRSFFEYEGEAGAGHLITTYQADGEPLPSFEGEPLKLCTRDDIDVFLNEVWSALDEKNRVSLYARYIDIATGETQSRLCNQNQQTGE